LNRGVACNFGDGFEHHDSGQLAAGDGAACVSGSVHAERLDAALAKFGANARAKGPVARDDEDDWHLACRV
jgi:hypothetical protein